MSSANKRKGSQWELDLLKFFRGRKWKAERLRLAGVNDEGDLAVIAPNGMVIIVEAKATKSLTPAEFVKEAELEADNWAKARGYDAGSAVPIVAFKRRQHSVAKAYVIISLDKFMEIFEEK